MSRNRHFDMFSRFFCGLAVAALTVAAVAPAESYYTAGVVEFRPTLMGVSSADQLKDHLQAYLEIIYSSEANETDIIVFPEGTLNNALQLTYVPADNAGVIPCLQRESHESYADFLVQLSCAARAVGKYLVINLTEKENCHQTAAAKAEDPRPCAANGLNVFNTNVVFDREGRVISRYRKVHVYLEQKNTTLTPEFAIFDTDFGVRFGHFICFDILFYTPAQEMAAKHGVKDFIFTSYFYSELPFLTAVQLQHSWAWGNDVNLLAAGASYPQTGTTGTGIFAGSRGQLAGVMATGGAGLRQLYVARVPKNGEKILQTDASGRFPNPMRPRQPTSLKLLRDPQIENFNSELINFTIQLPTISQNLCMNGFCCDFHVTTEPSLDSSSSSPSPIGSVAYVYRIGVFNGRRSYEKEEWSDIQVCALYACRNESVGSCGAIFNDDNDDLVQPSFAFKSIHVEGQFRKADKLVIMPSSLDESLYPLSGDWVDWQVFDDVDGLHHDVHFRLNRSVRNLLTFGIYANYYEKSAALSQRSTSLVALITLFGISSIAMRTILRRI